MSTIPVHCDQAIFTSVRTPMGEGYRIIAASRGLRPEEKQAITRLSPSHHGLCDEHAGADNGRCPPPVTGNGSRRLVDAPASDEAGTLGEIRGVGFYQLPTGRLCVAASCLAGAEHTGRGGQRIYTHNVVIASEELARVGYNPFHLVRAMMAAGVTTPQLSPPKLIDTLELHVDDGVEVRLAPHASVCDGWGPYLLERMLAERRVILNIDAGWIETAEALLLGLPGPARTSFSFAAGLSFSVTRCHNIIILTDDKRVVTSRTSGQAVEYLAPNGQAAPAPRDAAWLTFVGRHWRKGDFTGLAKRTSRPFPGTAVSDRERSARLYNAIDGLPSMDSARLLRLAADHLCSGDHEREPELVTELLDRVQVALRRNLAAANWTDIRVFWDALVALASQSVKGPAFALPILEQALNAGHVQDPLDAADAALSIGKVQPPEAVRAQWLALLDRALDRLADWAGQQGPEKAEVLRKSCKRWEAVRPESPALQRLRSCCESAAPA